MSVERRLSGLPKPPSTPRSPGDSPDQESSRSPQWRLLDLIRAPKSKPLDAFVKEEEEEDKTVINCSCCGTVLSFQAVANKFRCSVCGCTNILEPHTSYFRAESDQVPHLLSPKYVKKIIDKCLADANEVHDEPKTLHQIFEPLSNYLYTAFKTYNCLNNSFKVKRGSTKVHYSTSNIAYDAVHDLFHLLTNLPTKRPLFSALQGALSLLKRTPTSFGEDARNYCWLLILLEIPFLSYALTHHEKPAGGKCSMIDSTEVKALSYDILKRVLGLVSNIQAHQVRNYLISWFSKLSEPAFVAKVDLVNVYITFHMKKYFYIANNPDYRSKMANRRNSVSHHVDAEYYETSTFKDELEQVNLMSPPSLPWGQVTRSLSTSRSKSKKNSTAKIRIYQYGNDWHLKTASGVLLILMNANSIRSQTLSPSVFYNSLVDYVNIKMDFDAWQSNKKFKDQKPSDTPEVATVLDYIHGNRNSFGDSASYFFCKFPFLITLGNKISILEYEAKRSMERKAEEAFINSLDKQVPLDVYLRVIVRRDHIVQDSLRCIKNNQENLKKSLRVHFVNEPGIDAGGLKKEWFLLLTKELFHPQTGMLVNVDDSNYMWFNLFPINDTEMYYLFGAILGLAIYNSAILDLNFSLAFYKTLLNLPVGFSDFQQLYPTVARSLFQLKGLSPEELDELDLTFDITVTDMFNKQHTRNLTRNGRDVRVTVHNRDEYIEKYAQFYLVDGISSLLHHFTRGFSSVIGGNALSLFAPQEIELLLCGNEEGKLDVDVLRSVTRYSGWPAVDAARESSLVKWFWEYLSNLDYRQQKKFLVFVSGSDRVPATGLQNMNFTIKRISAGDSERLPVAHTCFNELDLYNYDSREKLERKLTVAVNESRGFGIK